MTGELVTLSEVEVKRGQRVIAGASHLGIFADEVLAIIGPNGAGKSTLLGVAGLLVQPTTGQVLYRGQQVPRSGVGRLELRRKFGCVFQEPLLLDLTVLQNVALPLLLRGHSKRKAMTKAQEWLERLDIGHLRARNSGTLSGGEAQRVNLARTLISSPEVVFLDESFAALDTPTRERMMQELPELLKGRAAMLVTHDHGEARRLAGRVGVMLEGKLVQQGAVDDVFHRPQNLEIARFLGVENLVPVRLDAGSVVLPSATKIPCDRRLVQGDRAVMCLRAESVRIGAAGAHVEDIGLRGVVSSVRPRAMGFAVTVSFTGFALEARAWPGDTERFDLIPGAQLDIHFSSRFVHIVSS